MADLDISARFILEGSKDLVGQLEQAGRAGGQVFGESLTGEAQKRLDGIVNQAEAAAKRVGLAFNKTKLRFEDASGQVVPDDVFNRLAKLDKGLKDANRSLGQFAKEVNEAATGSISALRSRLGELTGQLERVAIGSQRFKELRSEINGIQQSLQRAAQAAQAFRPNLRTIEGLGQQLATLQRIQGRTTSAAGFDLLEVQIKAVSDQLRQIEQRKISINADPGSVAALRARLSELNTELDRTQIGSERFKALQRDIQGVEKALGRAAQAASTFRPNLGTGQGLQAELSRLQRIQGRTTSAEGVDLLQQRIISVQAQIDALNRRKLSIGVDPASILALRAQLDALNNQLGRAAIGSQQFRVLQREINGVERELRKAGEAGGIAARGVELVRGALGLLGGVSVGLAITQFLRSSIDQAIQLETATRRLTNTLGQQGAGAALGFVRGISDQLGLSFRDLVSSYGRFTAAATAANVPLQQQQELFTAVSRAGQSLGLTSDEVNGAFLALQQIASKGTVSMEELRQQLGERLPIALAATAKGLGMSTQSLIKLVETGQLSSNKFFPAFTKGLNDLTKGSQGMPTAAQNLQRFTNEWESLQTAFGESLLPEVIAQINLLTAALKNLKIGNIARDLGFGQTGFGGLSEGAQAMVSDAEKVQRKYNLTSKELSNVASEARKLAAVTRTPLFGTVSDDSDTIKRYGVALEERAKAFSAGKRDAAAAVNAEAAALTALQGKLNENVKAQQKSNALYGQRIGVSALQAEAELVNQVAAGRLSQADADKAMAGARKQALEEEIKGQDELIARLKQAKAQGAESGNEKALLAAQSARAQKVLEVAKIEAAASQVEVQRRQQVLQLAQGRLDITSRQIELENTASQLSLGRLRAQQQVAEALLGLQQAQQGLVESQFGLDSARQGFALRTAEEELGRLRDRGAGVDAIRQQEERINGLKRGAENLEFRAMEASIAAAQQRFALERGVLKLKQQQQVLEAQSAQRAAAQNTLQQRQRLLELQGQLVDPSISAGQRQALQQQVAIQREAIGLAQQQQQAEVGRLQTLGVIFGLEQRTLAAQQQTTARSLATQAATKGWETALSGPLTSLDAAAGSTAQVAGQLQTISAGFITVGGQTVQIKTSLDAAAGSTAAAADAAAALANGYASANTQATALLGTLQRMASVPQARWAGGDVEPGTRYRINELGRESFMDRAGNLSMITAPRNGFWTPPTAGTVIPAGITASLAASGAFGAAGGSSGRGGGRAAAMAPQRSGSVQGVGKLNAAINRLTARMDALVAKDWNVRVVTPSSAGVLRSIGGY